MICRPGKRCRASAPIALLVVVLGIGGGCERAAPTPPITRPVLERPVTTLTAHGKNVRLLVPNGALVIRGGIPGVFVLQDATPFPPGARDAAGTVLPEARFRMVKTGKTAGRRVEILSGLSGDEVLILGDLSELRDGSPIAAKR